MTGTFLPRLTGEELADLNSRLTQPGRPALVGIGPAEFSTNLSLVPFPQIIWDTNRYYRDLGVDVRASRKEIKARYQALQGENSVRLTLIASVLLASEERARYDATPLGEMYFDAEIEQLIRDKALEASKGKPSADPTGFEPTIEELIERERNLKEIERTHNPVRRDHWSYYQWDTDYHDIDKLARWRACLAEVWYRSPLGPLRLAVGYFVGSEEVKVERVGYRTVAFLNVASEPTRALAWRAFQQWDNQATPNQTQYTQGVTQ